MGPLAAPLIFILIFPKVRRDAENFYVEVRILGTVLEVQADENPSPSFLQLSCFVILGGKCLLCTLQNSTSPISVPCSIHFETALSEWGDKCIHKIWIFINILLFAFSCIYLENLLLWHPFSPSENIDFSSVSLL